MPPRDVDRPLVAICVLAAAAWLIVGSCASAQATRVGLRGHALTLVASRGEASRVTVSLRGGRVWFADLGGKVSLGHRSKCQRVSPRQVRCSRHGVRLISLSLGRGPDRATVSASVPAAVAIEIRGGRRRNRLYGGRGYAVLIGGSAGDTLVTGSGGGELYGGSGNDKLVGQGYTYMNGGPGNDLLIAGRGGGELHGGPGNDRLVAGAVATDIFGEAGNDTVWARNGEQDTIDCGDGQDTAYVDTQEDGVFDCENVISPGPQ